VNLKSLDDFVKRPIAALRLIPQNFKSYIYAALFGVSRDLILILNFLRCCPKVAFCACISLESRNRPFGEFFPALLLLVALFFFMMPAKANGSTDGSVWRFSAGYVYYSGFEDIRSIYKKNAAVSGSDNDIVQLSFGFSLQCHRRITENLHVGSGIGPVMTLLKDATHIQVPASVFAIITPFPDWSHTPFIRAGGSYHITRGDYLENSRPGILSGLGVAFFAQQSLHLAIEAAYDGAFITIERPAKSSSRKIRAGTVVLSISAVF